MIHKSVGWKRKYKNVSFFLKGKFHQRACPTLHRTDDALPLFSFLPHPLLSSFQYNNSNYVQTTKHASSNDSTDMGKLAHLHNNKWRFEPIESLLTFKWYKDVISKVCAYPGWLSVWMCGEWSNSHASDCAPHSSVHHWQPNRQCFVIGAKREAEKVGGGSRGALSSTKIRMG